MKEPHDCQSDGRREASGERDEGLRRLVRATTAWILFLVLVSLGFAFVVSAT